MASKEQRRTLRAMGITMLGVMLSVGVSVGFGVPGPWYARIGAGVATVIVLVTIVKIGTSEGSRGYMIRAADWITGEEEAAKDQSTDPQ